ncbi:DUF4983 domain-containing protein [Mucilaginibacter panaciglaebae]|uniref:DUF4983 domain-containing protein n=1 Tax=Mucilaginibacter panaciglaebae TaxID=502331 RepID=A0ABP7X5N5_9SPHI
MKNFKTKLFGASLFLLAFASSCKHDYGKMVPPLKPDTAKVVYKTPKVLYIIADGARGVSVRDANIPNLKSLLPHAIYSWTSLSDTIQTDASNWADMITGVKKEKHNVLTEDFAGNALASYPPIFQRIKSVRPNFRTAVFSASAAFKNNLSTGAAVSEGFSSDDALKSRMVDFLKTDTAQVVVGEFAGIEAAGKAVGFDNQYPAYKAAIETFDTQVGAILTAIKSRPTYGKENWMIIVTSNRGGAYTIPLAEDDRTIFSNANSNTFTIIAADTYNQTFLAKPFLGNQYAGKAIRFIGDPQKGIGQVSPAKSTFFNFGDTSGFTISVKVKKHKNPINVSRGDYYYQWPAFVGKKGTSLTNSTPATGWGNDNGPGWDFALFQNGWRFFLSGVGSFKGGKEMAGLNFTGDTWHDLTAVVERKPDGSKVVRVYTDGVMAFGNNNGSGAITTGPYSTTPYTLATTGTDVNLDNASPLRIGYVPGQMDGDNTLHTFGKIDVELKELKIFKTAIPDAIVKEYACDQSIDQSHPYYAYLIGYWPMDEGSGTTIADKGPLAADFTLSQAQAGGYSWQTFSDLICSPVSSNLALLVPKNSDIPTQILSWLNIPRQSAWGLDGKVWITN